MLSSLEALWLISSKLATYSELDTIFCLFDGLDECHEDALKALVSRILNLLSYQGSIQDLARSTAAFKLAVANREIPGLQGLRGSYNSWQAYRGRKAAYD